MNKRNSLHPYYNFCISTIVFIIALIPIQMVFFILYPHPSTIVEWFTLFKTNPIIGFISFDVLYALSNILMLFLFISLFIIVKNKINNLTVFAVILAITGITIYFSSHRSIEMYIISGKYFEATSAMQKMSFIAAGDLLLSIYKGSAYFVYYILNGLSLILLFRSFNRIEFFSKRTVSAGILSGILMLVPATVGVIGMTMALLSLIPWIITCIFLISDINKNKNLTITST